MSEKLVQELPTQPKPDEPGLQSDGHFFFASVEHVPAPQLACPVALGLLLGGVAWTAAVVAAGLDDDTVVVVVVVVVVVAAAAVVMGAAVAVGAAPVPLVLATDVSVAFALHDAAALALGVGVALDPPEGVFVVFSSPPHATTRTAEVPSAASVEAR